MKKTAIITYFIIIFLIIILIILFAFMKKSSLIINPQNKTQNQTLQNNTDIIIKNQTNTDKCIDSDNGENPLVKGTTQGINGVFTDKCDSNGNLTEYYCAYPVEPGVPDVRGSYFPADCPNSDTKPCNYNIYNYKPKVENYTIDCNGKCLFGKCLMQCPDAGEILTYIKADITTGNATLKSDKNKIYNCALSEFYQANQQSYNCKIDPSEGIKVKVITAQDSSGRGYCTSKYFILRTFDIRFTSGTSQCSYKCSLED